jgi:hypothetical protein
MTDFIMEKKSFGINYYCFTVHTFTTNVIIINLTITLS